MSKKRYFCRAKSSYIMIEVLRMVEIRNKFLYELSLLKESEDHIEFKEAKRDFDYNGGSHKENKE